MPKVGAVTASKKPTPCVACEGTGRSSSNRPCEPCAGSGIQGHKKVKTQQEKPK